MIALGARARAARRLRPAPRAVASSARLAAVAAPRRRGLALPVVLLVARARDRRLGGGDQGRDARTPGSAARSRTTLRRAFDRDHDGYSRFLGGGDCDDSDPQRPPRRARDPRRRHRSELHRRRRQRQARRRPTRVRAGAARACRRTSTSSSITIDTHARRSPRHVRLRARRPRRTSTRSRADGTRVRARLGARAVDALLDARDPDRPAAARRLLRHLDRGLARPAARRRRRSPRRSRRSASSPARSRTTGTSIAAATWIRASPSTTTRTRGSTPASPAPAPSRPTAARRRSRPTRRSRSSTRHAAQRWFLWVHYYDPHSAYEPHPEVPSFGSDRDRAATTARSRSPISTSAGCSTSCARKGLYDKTVDRRHRRSRRGLRRARRRATTAITCTRRRPRCR